MAPRRERGAPQPIAPLPLNNRERRLVTRDLVLPRTRDEDRPPFPFPVNHGLRSDIEGNRPRGTSPNPRPQSPSVDDLVYVNRDPDGAIQEWVPLRQDEWEKIEARIRRVVRVHDDFITIPFPRIASTSDHPIAQAVESYKREAAVVDPRLSREVSLQSKATALSDLCDRLRGETGIQIAAGPTVADEKVTLFCEKLPLREVMRQLSRAFGYTWLRSKKEGG